MEANKDEKIVQYAPYCTRGEIIALLYNHAVRLKGGSEISPEVAEELVDRYLGTARTLDGKIIPSLKGFINVIEGVVLNVYCYDGVIDVSEYPHGDGRELIQGLITKRQSEVVKGKSSNWKYLDV